MKRGFFLSSGFFALTTLACGAAPSATKAPATTTVPAVAKARVVRGHVLGYDAKPLPLAHLRKRGRDGKPSDEIAVGPDGTFEVPLGDDKGIVSFEVTGVGHRQSNVLVVAEEGPIDLEIRLGTYAPKKELGDVPIVFLRDEKRVSSHPMTRTSDGRFVADVPLADGTYDYEITGLVDEG